ncbi:hypothetical protein JOC33_002367 [Thalassobacillus pellis]|nr:hypothetical protein [Thalassobacillus pellis]
MNSSERQIYAAIGSYLQMIYLNSETNSGVKSYNSERKLYI